MTLPTVSRRTAVEPSLHLSPAITPQCPLASKAGPAQKATDGAAQTAPWGLRAHLLAYRCGMRFGSQALGRMPHLFARPFYYGNMTPLAPHAPVPVSGDFPCGKKWPFAFSNGEHMSVLRSDKGERYLLSRGLCRGGYGKLRVAMNAHGKLFAVKEMRLEGRDKKEVLDPQTPRKHTKVSKPAAIRDEIDKMAAASRSMTVRACMEAQGKVYLFMPLMADDATTLATGTPKFARTMVGRRVLARACEDLAAIHARGYIHHDVKLHNILWNAAGAAALTDFGFTCMVDEATGTTRDGGYTVGNMPLEYERGEAFSWGLDIFMLGLAMAEFYAFDVRQQPEHSQEAMAQMQALESWRHKVLDTAGHVGMDRMGELPGLTADERMWADYFARVCEADGPLGRFIIERMLGGDAQGRASLAEVAAFVEKLQPADGLESRAAAQVMRTMANNDWDRQHLLRHMRHFKQRVHKVRLGTGPFRASVEPSHQAASEVPDKSPSKALGHPPKRAAGANPWQRLWCRLAPNA